MNKETSYGNACPAAPKPVSDVEEALGILEGTINGLAVAADQIETRVSSALRPVPPQSSVDTAGESPTFSVPLAANIKRQSNRVQNINEQLQSILSRLGL